jgi:alpha-beta hydrolase superfamily lysophospholipase
MEKVMEWMLDSPQGEHRYVREWPNPKAAWIALLAHGYGEHIGRYGHVAEALREAGAAVLGIDHQGHGRSGGERVWIEDFEVVVDDLHRVALTAFDKYPDRPMVLIGHSMGGLIAARYAQHHGAELTALVLSGPMFGARPILEQLVAMVPIPEIPIDPAALSRDPAVGKAYANDPLIWHGAFRHATLNAMIATMNQVQEGPCLGPLPLLYLHGEADMLVPLAATRPVIERLRGAVYESKFYPGAMHEVFNEINRGEVLQDLIGFIRRFLAPS